MASSEDNRAALVIGINRYAALSADGAADLKGARNDAVSWACVARGAGIRQIRVLASPPLTAEDLPFDADGVTFGDATAAEITDGVRWLAEVIGGEGVGQGMMAYSGHGSQADGALVLCPSDTVPDLSNTIPYADIAAALSEHAPETSVTFFLDTCHAAPPRRLRDLLRAMGRRSLVSHGTAVADLPRALRPTDTILAACRAQEISQEGFIQNGPHGAFTWAVTAALSRAGVLTDAETGFSYFNISTQALRDRVHGLLYSIGYTQRPTLRTPPALATLPLLHPRTPDAPSATPSESGRSNDKEILPEENDSGNPMGFALYRVDYLSGAPSTYMLATNSNDISFQGKTFRKNREYWFWPDKLWPQESFSITMILSEDLPAGVILEPSAALCQASQPDYPYGSKFPPISTAHGISVINQPTWWSIRFDQTTPPIAWLNTVGSTSSWYEYSNTTWSGSGSSAVTPQRWLVITRDGVNTVPNGQGGTIPYTNHYLYFIHEPTGPYNPPATSGSTLPGNLFVLSPVVLLPAKTVSG